NFQRTEQNFTTYYNSVGKFAGIAKARNVDVQMANHPNFDNAFPKMAALKARRAGQPHPFVVGWDVQQRIFDVQQECALAQRATLRVAASAKKQRPPYADAGDVRHEIDAFRARGCDLLVLQLAFGFDALDREA